MAEMTLSFIQDTKKPALGGSFSKMLATATE